MTVDNSGIAGRDGRIYVAYIGGGLHAAYSTDGGGSFNVQDLNAPYAFSPMVTTAVNGDVYLVRWNSYPTDRNLKVHRSTDGGVTWTGPTQICGTFMTEDVFPYVAADYKDPASLYVVFNDFPSSSDPTQRIKFVRSTDFGAHWSSPLMIDDVTPGGQKEGTVCSSQDGRIHVTYLSWPGSSQYLYEKTSLDQGVTWQSAQLLTTPTTTRYFAEHFEYMGVASLPGSLRPIWTDFRNSQPPPNTNTDIFSSAFDYFQPSQNEFATAYGSTPKTI